MSMEQITQQPKPSSSSNGSLDDNKFRGREISSRQKLIYLATCFIGLTVEVQIKSGSIFSGIFHALNADDAGVILKMVRFIKCGTVEVKNLASDSVKRRFIKTMIIPSEDIVQVIAKDVATSGHVLLNDVQHEECQDITSDTEVSQSSMVDVEKELDSEWTII